MRTKQVECIVFRKNNASIEFLLLKRIPEKGKFWQPPCGGVEQGEKLLDAVYREIREETGVQKENIIRVIKDVYSFTMETHYLTGEKTPPLTEFVFGVEVLSDVVVSFDENKHKEHSEYRWVLYNEAIKLLKWEDNKKAFAALKAILDKDN